MKDKASALEAKAQRAHEAAETAKVWRSLLLKPKSHQPFVQAQTKAAQAKDAALSLKARYDALPPWAQELIQGGATLLVRLV